MRRYNKDKAWGSFNLDQAFVYAVLFAFTLQPGVLTWAAYHPGTPSG
jgi:hypothetical protein